MLIVQEIKPADGRTEATSLLSFV